MWHTSLPPSFHCQNSVIWPECAAQYITLSSCVARRMEFGEHPSSLYHILLLGGEEALNVDVGGETHLSAGSLLIWESG